MIFRTSFRKLEEKHFLIKKQYDKLIIKYKLIRSVDIVTVKIDAQKSKLRNIFNRFNKILLKTKILKILIFNFSQW